jgi:hypothetical protein
MEQEKIILELYIGLSQLLYSTDDVEYRKNGWDLLKKHKPLSNKLYLKHTPKTF